MTDPEIFLDNRLDPAQLSNKINNRDVLASQTSQVIRPNITNTTSNPSILQGLKEDACLPGSSSSKRNQSELIPVHAATLPQRRFLRTASTLLHSIPRLPRVPRRRQTTLNSRR
ncbi:hypothetical protein KSP40_PGU008344 [Platanthera guangdongensis]|uniref:Uncharacterized protein n=1 Tax=Platanthera guangdongensis TaxID=2320717 RepID=A0ABR2M0U6_9ASPA